MFTPIKNLDVTVPDLSLPQEPFDDSNLAKLIKVKPNQDTNTLIISWDLPDYLSHYLESPFDYFTHLFGHEGKNSLLSYLKQENLAMGVAAGEGYNLKNVDTLFEVEITLTSKGFENYEDVLEAVFKYA